MVDLTILVCSTVGRSEDFYPAIMQQLKMQTANLKNVEVLCLTDNKIMSIGRKRNLLVQIALGKYVVFVDDDDLLSHDYVSSMLSKIQEDSDVIVFRVMYRNGTLEKPVIYDFDLPEDSDGGDVFYRIPNHLMCFKKEVAQKVSYEDISYGEDALWAKAIRPYIKTQSKIDKVLYTYKDNPVTSESRTRL
jgi:hypothetical protein